MPGDWLSPFLVCYDCSLLQLLIGLSEQLLSSSRMAAKLVAVVLLCFVDPLPRRHDVLLGGAQIAVPVTDVYNRSLREDRSTAAQNQSQGRSDKHVLLDQHDCFSLISKCGYEVSEFWAAVIAESAARVLLNVPQNSKRWLPS